MNQTKIERLNGDMAYGQYVRHLRTLTNGCGPNVDLDLYRLADGAEIVCESLRTMARETEYDAVGVIYMER